MVTRSQGIEFRIFVERYAHFMNLWTVYTDYLKGRYVPSIDEFKDVKDSTLGVQATLMFILYSYFYSLIEDGDESINALCILRVKFPEEEKAIAAVESRVLPFRDRLRVFRNRLGFHGSRTREREEKGLELFIQHSGSEIYDSMLLFKSLGAALMAKANVARGVGPFDDAQVRAWIDSIIAGQPHAPRSTQPTP